MTNTQESKYYISHVFAKNWKNFPKIDLEVHPKKNLLIGANASGKTNFLDLLRFIGDVSRTDLKNAVNNRGGLTALRFLKYKTTETEVTIKLTIKNYSDDNDVFTYELSFKNEKGGLNRLYIEKEILTHRGNIILNIDEQNDNISKKEDRLQTLIHNQYLTNKTMKSFFENIFYFHLNPLSVRKRTADDRNKPELDPSGSNFIEILYKTKKTMREKFLDKSTKALKTFIPNLECIKFGQDENGIYHLFLEMKGSRNSEMKQDEILMSDGTLRLLGLLWSIYEKSSKSSILLIEEPELSLHTEIINHLPRLLHEIQRTQKVQVFITTHSQEMLREPITSENVFGIYFKDKGSQIQSIRDWKEFQVLEESGFTLSESSNKVIKKSFSNQLPLL